MISIVAEVDRHFNDCLAELTKVQGDWRAVYNLFKLWSSQLEEHGASQDRDSALAANLDSIFPGLIRIESPGLALERVGLTVRVFWATREDCPLIVCEFNDDDSDTTREQITQVADILLRFTELTVRQSHTKALVQRLLAQLQ